MENKYMSNKFERARTILGDVTQKQTYIGKGERLGDKPQKFVEFVDPTLKLITRQRGQAEKAGRVISTKDVMTLLNDRDQEIETAWGVVPLNQLIEWTRNQLDESGNQKYSKFADLRRDYIIVPIGGGECTIEIACDPSRQDIIDVFEAEGIAGLRRYLTEINQLITTDTPGIAESFFDAALLRVLSGSLEALDKSYAPVIIGIVQSGDSLEEEQWYRLSDKYPQAVLLRSQLVVVIKKQKEEVNMPKEFENNWNGSYRSGEKQFSTNKTQEPKEKEAVSINLPPADATPTPELKTANSGSYRN